MLVARSIIKRFGNVLALDGVDFEARRGEIHALLGENGAGKTTLMNIVAGRIRPDGGAVTLDDAPMRAGSAASALRAGIAAVHQSPLLFERFSWEENLALGGFGAEGSGALGEVAERSRTLAAQLRLELPPPGMLVEGRSIAERVRLEVLRALSFDPRVLILDEPTGVLAPHEIAPFLDLLRRLRSDGRMIVLITHKLAEAMDVADRITVLRRGRVVMRTKPSDTSAADLARAMIGELAAGASGSASEPEAPLAVPSIAAPDTALAIERLSLEVRGARVLDDIRLSLSRREIAGIAGVEGNGQIEFAEVLAGVREPTRGEIQVPISRSGQERGPVSQGMAVIPQNRDLDGLILDMPLWENFLLAPSLRERFAPRGWLNRDDAVASCARTLKSSHVVAAGPQATAASLSGGNRQRFEIARAIASAPSVIVAHNVTRGLDLHAMAEVHRTLRNFTASGGAVLLISSDLDELLALCTRIWVMSRGRLRETTANERDPTTLGLLMAGAK